MPYGTSDSAIKTDSTMNDKISKATTTEQIKEILRIGALAQGLAVEDAIDKSIFIPLEKAAAPEPRRFAKTIEVAGQKLIFESDSELEVERSIGDYFRALQPRVETQPEVHSETPRDERGRFVSEEDVVAKAELELKFKRGEIDTATYLAESGAVNSYLASQGISLEDLKKVANDGYQADWQTATQEFLSRHPEWVGGNANLKEAGETLLRLHLQDSPSVESLESAYQDMQRRNAVAENPELDAQRDAHEKISSATSFEEIRSASSSLFGRR